jgi:predicted nucleic acid-binding Zn ribbon protein
MVYDEDGACCRMAVCARGWDALMPIFVYECKKCDIKVEQPCLGRGNKKKRLNPICPECNKKMKWIKYPGHSIEFKGEGWTK